MAILSSSAPLMRTINSILTSPAPVLGLRFFNPSSISLKLKSSSSNPSSPSLVPKLELVFISIGYVNLDAIVEKKLQKVRIRSFFIKNRRWIQSRFVVW